MVSFYVYDITFLVIFTLAVFWFLRSRRKDLSREGWMFMYRSKFGVKAMDWFDKRFHRILGYTRYLILVVGYSLMAIMIYMLGQTVWLYLSRKDIVEQIAAPPIAPLIPYFPELFGLDQLFPPFYFTYFLVSLAVVAIVHEFSHGIFMRYSKTKIKSTGIVFLGPILGAFVEEDRKSFHSKDRFNQMAVLGAGVFANVIFAIIFYLLYMGFFYLTFSAGGFAFNSYTLGPVDVANVDTIYEDGNYTVLLAGDRSYYMDSGLDVQLSDEWKEKLFTREGENGEAIPYYVVYLDSPAFKSQIKGVVVGVNDVLVRDADDYVDAVSGYLPGDSLTIYTKVGDESLSYDVVVEADPRNDSRSLIGLYYYPRNEDGFRKFMAALMGFKMGPTYFEPTVNADIVIFFYHLLWWVMIINVLVALFNMLPLGILDGGRFFYLTVEKFFGKKVGEKAFLWASRIIFGSFILIFLVWLYRWLGLKIGF